MLYKSSEQMLIDIIRRYTQTILVQLDKVIPGSIVFIPLWSGRKLFQGRLWPATTMQELDCPRARKVGPTPNISTGAAICASQGRKSWSSPASSHLLPHLRSLELNHLPSLNQILVNTQSHENVSKQGQVRPRIMALYEE